MYVLVASGLATVPSPTIDERVTTLEADNDLLNQQLKAASDQNDFLEDCVAEMVQIVYA